MRKRFHPGQKIRFAPPQSIPKEFLGDYEDLRRVFRGPFRVAVVEEPPGGIHQILEEHEVLTLRHDKDLRPVRFSTEKGVAERFSGVFFEPAIDD